MLRLCTEGNANAFIRESKATKEIEMYDAVQAMHPKTLRACFILATCTSKCYPEIGFRDMMETVMESGPQGSLLNLKVKAYHGISLRAGDQLPRKPWDDGQEGTLHLPKVAHA